LQEIYEQFRDQADFYVVYVREAHPTDGWQVDSNIAQNVLYAQHSRFQDRRAAADACARGLALTIPILLDDMANTADLLYRGWPERLYILASNRTVAYQGGKGPYGFDSEELNRKLSEVLQASG
jgi:hypothetical protein